MKAQRDDRLVVIDFGFSNEITAIILLLRTRDTELIEFTGDEYSIILGWGVGGAVSPAAAVKQTFLGRAEAGWLPGFRQDFCTPGQGSAPADPRPGLGTFPSPGAAVPGQTQLQNFQNFQIPLLSVGSKPRSGPAPSPSRALPGTEPQPQGEHSHSPGDRGTAGHRHGSTPRPAEILPESGQQ